MDQTRLDRAIAALLFAYCNSVRRSDTRQKWTSNDQRSHEKLRAALLEYMDEGTLETSVMQIVSVQSIPA
jgi:hypothetical protein